METTSAHNLNNEQVLTRLSSSGDFDKSKLFEIRVVFQQSPQTKSWQPHSALIKPAYRKKEEISHIYQERAFIKKYKNFSSIKEIIDLLNNNGIPINIDSIPNLTIKKNTYWHETIIPTIHSKYGCPIRHYTIDTGADNLIDCKLISHNLPFFSSFDKRVKEFIPYNNYKHINILVEEGRARIDINNGIAKALSNIDSSIVGRVTYKNRVSEINTKSFPTEINLQDSTNTELWIIDSNNIIYDYISSTEYPYTYKPEHTNISEEDYIHEKIENGETIDCEFKKFINLNKGEAKPEEIDRTVCAFSNTKGGTLIFGVTDAGETIGIDEQVRRTYGTTIEESTTKYINDLSKRLYENLADSECFNIRPIKIFGKQLVIIVVTKSSRWNTLQTNDVPYARKGSTNYNATRLISLELEASNRKSY
ncbi:MAG: ATP-binding protein [Gammaproteobacteria bacterium]|nr:ATP-binding protein [Gammaproteobacteria bacterium]